jgi:hypothetical protein
MIEVPAKVWRDTVDVFRSCGAGRRECVAYWVAPCSEPDQLTRAVHPKHSATRSHYEVEGAWLTGFWVELARAGETVRAQVHTHGRFAGHSPTDDAGALVYQEGFLSLVLPWFAKRLDPRDGAYLVELSAGGEWKELPVEERLRWS